MTAKVIFPAAPPGTKIDIFDQVLKLENALNGYIRNHRDASLDKESPQYHCKRRELYRSAETIMRPCKTGYHALYSNFRVGGQNRMLQVLVNSPDHDAYRGCDNILMSLGMDGDYKEILATCAQAMAMDCGEYVSSFIYTDDGMEEGAHLTASQLIKEVSQRMEVA